MKCDYPLRTAIADAQRWRVASLVLAALLGTVLAVNLCLGRHRSVFPDEGHLKPLLTP